MQRNTIIKLSIILSFLFCYFDMGHDGGSFLGVAEYFMISNSDNIKEIIRNPFLIAVLSGQLLLLSSFFKFRYSRIFTFFGILLLGIIVLFLFIIGLVTLYIWVTASTIPFIFLSTLYILKDIKETNANT